MRAFQMLVLTACLAAPVPAQEGHPLTGTWSGDWGAAASSRTHLTVVIEWDDNDLTGTINPGPDAVPIGTISLDVVNWAVRFDAETKDPSGKPVRIRAEGRIEDIGSWHRTLSGTWTQGTESGEFRLTRN
jgi:hypothetical protein